MDDPLWWACAAAPLVPTDWSHPAEDVVLAIVFDLDGTLADSRLDFEAMRQEMGLPAEQPILEAIEHLSAAEAERCHAILHRHEREGAARATRLPGVTELFAELDRRRIRRSIATRNSREIAQLTLSKLALRVDLVLTRDDGPVKPDPWAVHESCRHFAALPSQVAVVGDYRFDIEAGRAAGSPTVLLTHADDPRTYPNDEQADLVLRSLAEFPRLLAWLDSL